MINKVQASLEVKRKKSALFSQELEPEVTDLFPEQEVHDTQVETEVLRDIKKKTVSGAISYFIRTIFLQGIGLASVAVLSWYFTPEDFGIYGLVIPIVGLLTFFSDVGLAASLIQKKSDPTKADYVTAFTIQQALSWVIVGIVLLVLATGVIQAKTGPAGVWILLSLALGFPLASLKTIPSVILERRLEFSKLVIPQIIEQLVFNGILIFLAIKGVGAMAYAYAIFMRSIVGALSMFMIQPWALSFGFSKVAFAEMFKFGVKFQINDFLARIKDQLFYLVLGLYLNLAEFGYINWGKNYSMYPYNLTVQNVMAITFPTFSRLQGNTQALKRAIEKSIFFITLAIFPILVGMSVFIWPFIQLIPKWQKWEPAVFSLVLFSLSIAWSAVSTPLTNTLNAIGQINKTLKLMMMWTILTWIVTPICVYMFGYNGVAIASFFISFTSIFSVIMVKKVVPLSFIDQVWRQTLASVAMAVVGGLGIQIWSQSFKHFLFGMLLTALTYFVTLLLFGKNKVLMELRSLRS
ncbi:MAG: lipopolysaccharide biosynthesis protein [Patescibacteria group bacterium]|nr:MAG: lipopolysaccharide biosynthesis protein [Patescibacteria group bacterium]